MKRRIFLRNTLAATPAFFLNTTLISACGDDEVNPNGKSIIVIGGGIAGLAAAKKLKLAGFEVTVIESQEKVGGRLRTDRSLGVPFDEGASWIHGPSGNPITGLAAESGASTFLTADDSLKVYDINGLQYDETILDNVYSDYEDALTRILDEGTGNQSFEAIFASLFPNNVDDRVWKFMLSAYLEFDTGSDITELSSIDFDDDEIYSGDDVIITNGYDTVTNFLAKDLTVKLNERITAIDYSGAKAKVSSSAGNYEADYVIVTVPLGVLKNNIIGFSPALPNAKKDAISKMKMSAVNKFLLVWDDAFWDNNVQYVGFTPETKGKFNYFLNAKKFMPANALMTFAFGNYGKLTEQMLDSEIITEIMSHLKAIYGNNIPNPISMLRTKWSTNIHTYGSYSFPTNGTRSSDFDVLAQSVNDKLFFAGEHTEKDYRGTVHGAYLSGIREADKIIDLN